MLYSKKILQTYIAEPLPKDEELVERISLYAFEVEGVEERGGDSVFDISVLPNRAHDCLSHRGMAREIATVLNVALTDAAQPYAALEASTDDALLSVTVDSPAACPRYSAVRIQGVKVGPSPAWLVESLAAIGQRSINNVVDATNYILNTLGQPLHAFDVSKMAGSHIHVRFANEGEKITLLSGDEVTLTSDALCIADGTSNALLGIAGIKGGTAAQVDVETTDIILESANFASSGIRKIARPYNLLTDAAKRFEQGLTPELAHEGLAACAKLILELAGGNVCAGVDVYPEPQSQKHITVSAEACNKVLGTQLSVEELESIVRRRGWKYEVTGNTLTIAVPKERLDLESEIDIIDDVGQLYGFGNIEARPQTVVGGEVAYPAANTIRAALMSLGFSEVYTYAFRNEGNVEVANPIASDKAFLRSTLVTGVTESLEKGLVYADEVCRTSAAYFEIDTVFLPEGERLALAFGARDTTKKQTLARGLMQQAQDALANLGVAVQGDTQVVEVLLDASWSETISTAPHFDTDEQRVFAPFSPYPSIIRDIALFAPSAGIEEEIAARIVSAAPELVRSVRLFDVFTKPDEARTSYAFRLVLQAFDRTLTEADAAAAMEPITLALTQAGYEIR